MDNSWAKPGVRCVCVEEYWHDVHTGARSAPPEGGPVFKIVSVIEHQGLICIGLWGDVLDHYWQADGFRPVVDRETPIEDDIALFAPILHGQPVEA